MQTISLCPGSRRSSRASVAAVVLAVSLLSVGDAARAEDERAGARFFDGEYERVRADCAARLFDLVKAAREQSFNGLAVEEGYRVLLFEPDHAEARESLGFVKKAGGWLRDPDKAALLDLQNRRRESESAASFEGRIQEWGKDRDKANREIALRLVELGKACAAKGFESQAQRAYARALAADSEVAEAHAALGHVRAGDLWLSPDERTAYEKAVAGMPVAEQTPLEAELGTSLRKSQTRHFLLQVDSEDLDLNAAARITEATYACFLADFGIDPKADPFASKRARLSLVNTSEAWDAWLTLYAPESERDAARRAASYCNLDAPAAATLRSDPAAMPDPLDPLLLDAARLMARRAWHIERSPWLDAGLGAYYALKVRGRTRVLGAAADPEMPAACSSENWRPYLYELVRRRADEDLTKIAAAKADALDTASIVKAWAVVAWLMETDRAKFVEYLRALAEDDAKPDPTALRVFGKNLFGIDRAWRAHALVSY